MTYRDIIVHRFPYRGPSTSASTLLSVPSPCSVLSNRIIELFSSSNPACFFHPPPLSTLHEFTDCLLDAVVFTLHPLNNPSPSASDLTVLILARILDSAPDQESPMVS